MGSLLIKDSAQTTENQSVVTDTLVYLATTATDYPQAGGEGVTHLRYVEFEYSQGARLWIPVQDSGWIVSDTINANNYRWKLTPVGGIHYIQAWAKDSAGNISHHPHQERVNYLPSAEGVDRTQVRIYRQTLSQGEQFSATLTPISGDPDLYVWPPDWADGRDPWVSDSFTDTERLSFSAPVSGVYQIEVHGYDSAQYRLDIEVGIPVVVLAARAPTRITGFKPWDRMPAVPPQQEPPVDTFPQEADRLYLPVVLRSTGSFSK